MAVTIELSDNQIVLLEAKAAAEGLSIEQWIQKLVGQEQLDKPLLSPDTRTGADLIVALQSSPYRAIDIEPERYYLPVRDVSL